MNIVLGAGLAGLSCAHHLGKANCLILEKNDDAYGHIRSTFREGFTWDEGPHVSFTKSDYVRELFSASVAGEFAEYEVRTANYFRGHWIDHPAQSNLYQLPRSLREQCLASFLESRSEESEQAPANYEEWLCRAFGPVFAGVFPAAYTRKYWTRDARDLSVDWVGGRVFKPSVDDVVNGSKGPLDRQTHYISRVRYPIRGGYQAFARSLREGANVRFRAEVCRIHLSEKRLWTSDGAEYRWKRLINTLPLPLFISVCVDVPAPVRHAAEVLSCSQVLLVNATAPHPTRRTENWLYVYDEDKYATRINFTELLSPHNAPAGATGVQVEVYGSRHRPFDKPFDDIARSVVDELFEMDLLAGARGDIAWHTHFSPWANVIFDHDTAPALECIWSWLEGNGLRREPQDTHPLTDWSAVPSFASGALVMAGRFGQWKYFWSDDCVLRGRQVAQE